jgi:hypothetical protein
MTVIFATGAAGTLWVPSLRSGCTDDENLYQPNSGIKRLSPRTQRVRSESLFYSIFFWKNWVGLEVF